MFLKIKSKPIGKQPYIMVITYERLKQDRAVNSGVLVTKSSYEVYDFAEALKNFVSSDFTIDNIMNIGAYDMLKPMFVTTMSDMSFVDKFQDIKLVTDDAK